MLNDQIAAVPVDDEAGHPVPFGIDQTVSVRFRRDDLFPERDGPFDPPPPEIGVNPGGRIIGQKAEGDVAGVEKTEAEGPADAVRRKNNVAGRGIPLHPGERPGENPGVAVAKRNITPLFQYDPRITSWQPVYFPDRYSWMARAASLPAPMARMTVAEPVTMSPPA